MTKKRTGPKPRKAIGKIARELEALRLARGWSIGKWCALLGISRETYRRLRMGLLPLRWKALVLFARIAASDKKL